jgi:hypothetical protein
MLKNISKKAITAISLGTATLVSAGIAIPMVVLNAEQSTYQSPTNPSNNDPIED